MLPCLIFEDEHLLVVNKPAGLNTHAPAPYAGEGIYDWLRHREPRWANLAIIHRLDKETSGVLVFGKTPLANRSLTDQFTARTVKKKYWLLTDRTLKGPLHVRTSLARIGDHYASRSSRTGGELAETLFDPMPAGKAELNAGSLGAAQRLNLVQAQPLTGRTHQIRVHAAENGFPVFGDVLYGGTPAPRVYLHSAELALKHPASGQTQTFTAPAHFDDDPRLALRHAFLSPDETNAYRVLHGASDRQPNWYVERLGNYLFSQSEEPLTDTQRSELEQLAKGFSSAGVYHKRLVRRVRGATPAEASPQLVSGTAAPERFPILENGLHFGLSFAEGYSVGLFLDQRDNRRRLLTGHVAAEFPLFNSAAAQRPEVLNAFAYTCAFSVCAAKAGARTTSLDLSKKYLEWGKHNFHLNQIEPAAHDFIFGDVFDWFKRLAKKRRRFDVILLDPPTFSQSKESGLFRAEKDYAKLVRAALPLLNPEGVLFASTNAAQLAPEAFLAGIEKEIQAAGRCVERKHYVPQPADFPVSRAEPAYLKTVWLRLRR